MNELMTIGAIALAVTPVVAVLKIVQRDEDNPPASFVKAPPPRVYAAIRKALTGFYLGEYHYRIVTADPTQLNLRAVMEWRERKPRELSLLYPQGYEFHQLVLDVQVGIDTESGKSKVLFKWTSHGFLKPARMHLVQKATKQMLQEELSRIEAIKTQENLR
jgi:hypothetical protein